MNEKSHIWALDAEGCIVNHASRDPLPEDLLELCLEFVDLALIRFETRLHSIYLCGQGAWLWPNPVQFRIVLTSETATPEDLAFENPRQMSVRIWQATSQRVDVKVHGMDEARRTRRDEVSELQLRLGTNARCIAGEDLTRLHPRLKPSRMLARSLIGDYANEMLQIEAEAPSLSSRHRLDAVSRFAAQRTIETAFALILDKEGTYSECPIVMAGLAALHWPERRHSLAAAERIACHGIELALELSSFIDHHTRWVSDAVRERVTGGLS